MSVYGNIIAEDSNSIENDIHNINILSLEMSNYSTFIDEFIMESIDFKKIGERMKIKIDKLLEKLHKLIEVISHKWNEWMKNKNALDLRKDKSNKKVYINLDRTIHDYNRIYNNIDSHINTFYSYIEDYLYNSIKLLKK